MTTPTPEPSFMHGSEQPVGVLLVNLGTPDEPTPPAVRRYLKEFLSDPRVVEIPRLVWWPILNGIILNTRPKKTAAKYATIWMKEGSPLRVHTEQQTKYLRGYLKQRTSYPIVVDFAMRYGAPSIASALQRMREAHVDRLLIVPMYPQYAASTTATALDRAFEVVRTWRNVPAIRTVRHFHDRPGYIRALAQSVRDYWMKTGFPDKLVMSFHGLPRYTLDKGDPYHCECHKSARLLAEELNLAPEKYVVSFQSRFGRAQWLKPYTDEVLRDLGSKKLSRVDAMCPGFVADCLETLEEIALEGKQSFVQAGGGEYRYIPCLNENGAWLEAFTDMVLDELQGWLPPHYDANAAKLEREASARRALALGATR